MTGEVVRAVCVNIQPDNPFVDGMLTALGIILVLGCAMLIFWRAKW